MTIDRLPTIEAIDAAVARIATACVRTPLVEMHSAPAGIHLKLETFQPIGSFKLRGVYNAASQIDPSTLAKGLSTVSAGNTAQAVAWTGRALGVPARSLMPDTAPQTKIDAVRALGGEPILVPVDHVFAYMKSHGWEDEPFAFIHPWTNRDVMTGHATMVRELLEDRPDVETVFVPVGGGGLLGGVGSALKRLAPHVRVVAVEPEGCPAFHASLESGAPASIACDTICDGVAVPYITETMFPILSAVADDCVLVSEDDVRRTVRHLALRERIVAEPSAALSVAAAMAIDEADRGTSVCLITGGSIDAAKLAAILSQA